jgi:hypothetical protein
MFIDIITAILYKFVTLCLFILLQLCYINLLHYIYLFFTVVYTVRCLTVLKLYELFRIC